MLTPPEEAAPAIGVMQHYSAYLEGRMYQTGSIKDPVAPI